MNKNNTPAITFYVFRKDGSRNPDILRYFLDQVEITAKEAAEGYLTLADSTKWKLVLEPDVRDHMIQYTGPLRCLVSFQLRSSGAYAVARKWKPKDKDAVPSEEKQS